MMESDLFDSSKNNAWYPFHVSDRADELINEITDQQSAILYKELQNYTLNDWFIWLETDRESITNYDKLNTKQRNKKLVKCTDITILKSHHACIFIELWHARLTNSYFHLPPKGLPITEKIDHHRMMLAVVASYGDFDPRDLWPFIIPEGFDGLPFKNKC